ncbi:DUF4244 domain-containing protein [Aeromicrobium sp. 9AM]|uniref:DUF4244 domain-containing protein n=1 Tax=Aeromicrobium sp. 9AM TaxID=2653126 RepID=UPI0012F343C5|nr:DUF4244 domain-containing protein [Aeromicrobium sp. 9AM]VXB48012.1 conserved hypothetical protein [Aeromicrobium sp. 9AM]
MFHHDDRGMATAEYTVGTLGAVMIGAVLYRLGLLDSDNPWMESFRAILERALGWGTLRDMFDHLPRFGIRAG